MKILRRSNANSTQSIQTLREDKVKLNRHSRLLQSSVAHKQQCSATAVCPCHVQLDQHMAGKRLRRSTGTLHREQQSMLANSTGQASLSNGCWLHLCRILLFIDTLHTVPLTRLDGTPMHVFCNARAFKPHKNKCGSVLASSSAAGYKQQKALTRAIVTKPAVCQAQPISAGRVQLMLFIARETSRACNPRAVNMTFHSTASFAVLYKPLQKPHWQQQHFSLVKLQGYCPRLCKGSVTPIVVQSECGMRHI
jgi:hypothetical protein